MSKHLRTSVEAAVRRQHPGLLEQVSATTPKLRKTPKEVKGTSHVPRPSKFNNVVNIVTDEEAIASNGTLIAGEKFDSKLERKIAELLRARFGIRRVMRQVSFPLEGRVRMMPDFLILFLDREAIWIDAKGQLTPSWTNKRKQALARYGFFVHTACNAKELDAIFLGAGL